MYGVHDGIWCYVLILPLPLLLSFLLSFILRYQTTVDGDNAEVAMTDDNIAGLALWQFCDIKVDQSNTSSGRPGGINNKGVVSQWRAPKPAAAAVAAAYAKGGGE